MIAVGVAFGSNPDRQTLSDVLVSNFVRDYEHAKVHKEGRLILRGSAPPASRRLLDALHHLNQRRLNGNDRISWPRLHFGGILSGEKLVDNLSYREELHGLAARDDIIGGEMEATGLCKALEGRPVEWVVVKAICDWADGNKDKQTSLRQQNAAANSASVVKALLDTYDLYDESSGGRAGQEIAPVSPALKTDRTRQLVLRQQLPELSQSEPLVEGQAGLPTDLETVLKVSETAVPDGRTVVAFDDILEWVLDPQERPLYALLGEYGIGKTTTCQRLVAYLRERRGRGEAIPLPLYFDLRKVENVQAASAHGPGKVPTLQETIEDCLRHGFLHDSGRAPRYEEVLNAIDEGAVVIFDGLDEVLARIGDRQGLSFTANLLKVIPEARARRSLRPEVRRNPCDPAPRVLLSCRTQFFRNLAEQNNHFTGEHRGGRPASHYRALLLLPFTDQEIRAYLHAVFPTSDIDALMDQIESVHNLRDLASRPFTLKLVTQFIPRIEQWRLQGRRVTGATLYREVAREWLIRDKTKQSFQPEDKEQLAGDLAAYLWGSGRRGLTARELETWLGQWLSQQDPHADFQSKPRELLQEDLRNSTFLKRVDRKPGVESRFEFAHTSLQEFFLADHLLRALHAGTSAQGNARARWAIPKVTDETFDFLGQMLTDEQSERSSSSTPALNTLSSWGAPYLKQASEQQLRYAMRARTHGWPCPRLTGMDLSGATLNNWHFGSVEEQPERGQSRLDLSQVNFRNSRLRRVRFWNVTLDRAQFTGAILTQAEFLQCSLRKCEWSNADLVGALFRDSDFTATDNVSTPDIRSSTDAALMSDDVRFIRCRGFEDSPRWPVHQKLSLVLPTGHAFGSISCNWSSDGRWLVSGSLDCAVRMWKAATGDCVRILRGHWGAVACGVFSPDGSRIASGSDDGTVRLWDTTTGLCTLVLRGNNSSITCCAFSPDGRRLIAGSSDGTLRLWNTATGKCERRFRNRLEVRECVFSVDGRSLLAATAREVNVWDASTGTRRRHLKIDSFKTSTCAFSPDGETFVYRNETGGLTLISTRTGDPIRLLDNCRDVEYCSCSLHGNHIVMGSEDGEIRLWNSATGEFRTIGMIYPNRLEASAFSPDGRLLATNGKGPETYRIWNIASQECLVASKPAAPGIGGCAFSPDGFEIATVGWDEELRLWTANSGECTRVLEGEEDSCSLHCAYSPDGRWIATTGWSNEVGLWEVSTGRLSSILKGHSSTVNSCVFSPDARRLLSASADTTLRLWNPSDGKCVQVFESHNDEINDCVYSLDGHLIASASDDETVRLWNPVSGVCTTTLAGHASRATCCAFSPDGNILISGSSDGKLRVWKVQAGKCVRTLRGHLGMICHCAYSPEGLRAVSGGWDGTLRIWNTNTWECDHVLSGHDGYVRHCAFSPDGHLIASAADDGTLRIWDVTDGKCLRVHLAVHAGSAAWSPTTDEILHVKGNAWRYLGWFGQDVSGAPAVWPLEAAPRLKRSNPRDNTDPR